MKRDVSRETLLSSLVGKKGGLEGRGEGAIIKMEGNELPSLSTPRFTIRFSDVTALREAVPRF